MTAVELSMSADVARSVTDRIKLALEATWQLVAEAYQGGAHLALGYGSWDEYVTREFGTSRLRLPREERQEVVASLRDAGMSIRAIAATTGASDQTVQRDLAARSESLHLDPPAPSNVRPFPTPLQQPLDGIDDPDDDPEPEPRAPAVVLGRDGKSYPAAPQRRTGWSAEQQRQIDEDAELRRIAAGIGQLATGWLRFKQLKEQPHKRERVVALLNDGDRADFEEIERRVIWP